MIIAVLLQPGKADAGALFTSSVSSTAFGPRGTQTLLAKITIIAAALFMLIALTLSLPGVTTPRSVLQSQPEAPAQPAASPAVPPQSNASPATQQTESTTPSANINPTGVNNAATTTNSPGKGAKTQATLPKKK